MGKKVLYVGGFEMPDKNAAAQRVLSIAKALRDCGYDVIFYGITKTDDFNGSVDGFSYEAHPYPLTLKEWIKYAVGWNIISVLKRLKPNYVFTYNYPAVAQERTRRWCSKYGIKVVGDITEWYQATNIIKWLDVTLRMRYSNKHLDGVIAISRYLANYYKKQNILELPPMIDRQESKWHQEFISSDLSTIKLVYIGSPGIGKDRLDYIFEGILHANRERFVIDIVGITKEQYLKIYNRPYIDKIRVNFHGRLSHVDAIKLLLSADFHIFFRNNTRVNNAGFPTKFVESMGAGIPVITNQVSNVADYIIHGKNGFIIEKPKKEKIQNVLHEVANLSAVQVNTIKDACDKELFDYRNYSDKLSVYMKNI